ncbi:MAG: ATP-binding protein [Gemmatimonadaceae bacterium]|nr:ATP-binding protein [Gemmatimonadaceae bacterium]
MAVTNENPFRISGTVHGQFFTDRDAELARIRAALLEPSHKLLLYGPRRIGKTSTLANAVAAINKGKGFAFMADLSTVTTITDMANKVMTGASVILGRSATRWIRDLAGKLQFAIKMTPDPITGAMVPSLDVTARDAAREDQQRALEGVLDSLDGLAAQRGVTLGLVFDEFQEIGRLGGENVEWHLRGVMQRHQHLSYVAAGSKPSLLKAMVGKGRAFYQLFTPLHFRPIERHHLSDWIDSRMDSCGLVPMGAGATCVAWAGPRTRDIVRLARKCVDRAPTGSHVGTDSVLAAFLEIIDEDADFFQTSWASLTSQQQNLLRAVAGAEQGLTTKDVRGRFGLDASGTVTNALTAFVGQDRLVRTAYGSTYAFDNPYERGWVITRTLADIGMVQTPTFIASPTSEYDEP